MPSVMDRWPQLSNRIRNIYEALIARDAQKLRSLPNVQSVYDLNLVVSSLDTWGVDFGHLPEEYIEHLIIAEIPEGVGIEVPFWDRSGQVSDVYFELWIEEDSGGDKIYLKGHDIL